MSAEGDVVTGSVFDKYRSSNAIHRRLMDGFLSEARSLLADIPLQNVLEVGCGPGDLAHSLFASHAPKHPQYLGVDIGDDQVALARTRYPKLKFEVASAYQLPTPDSSYNLVVACEVLEHLEAPDRALKEMHRVATEWLLLSVPWEPLWRMLNMARGKYLSRFGNTPGHVQHFSRKGITKLVSQHFEVLSVRTPLPWTMLLAQKKLRS